MKDDDSLTYKELEELLYFWLDKYKEKEQEIERLQRQKEELQVNGLRQETLFKLEIERLNNIINELEHHLYQEWLEWKDSDCESIYSRAGEDKAIYDYLQELKGSE